MSTQDHLTIVGTPYTDADGCCTACGKTTTLYAFDCTRDYIKGRLVLCDNCLAGFRAGCARPGEAGTGPAYLAYMMDRGAARLREMIPTLQAREHELRRFASMFTYVESLTVVELVEDDGETGGGR